MLTLPPIDDLHNPALEARLRHRLDHKTKPIGSLGRLESLALQIGLVLDTEAPRLTSPQMVVFAADHGMAAHGVSAYPTEVTWQMVQNFLAGGAAVSVLARQHALNLTVVDAGVARSLEPAPGLLIRKIAPGTQDATQTAAMTASQCEEALQAGFAIVESRPGNVLLLGEMGIGNSSSAALLMARLTGQSIVQCVGRGTGVDDLGLSRKTEVLRACLERHAEVQEPLSVLAAFGGFEIAMMVGAVLAAAAARRLIVVDGFIASSAVLVACALRPAVLQRCVFSHRSDEQGHARMLAHLGAEPLLHLGLRLGEGSGAALAWPLIDSAARLLTEMASFESAHVSMAESDGVPRGA